MQINFSAAAPAAFDPPSAEPKSLQTPGDSELRAAFDQFVGETFYGQMLKAMRQTVGKPAYFHGGRAEEVFSSHLDQVLAEQLGKSGADGLSDALFEQFLLSGRGRG